MTELSFPQFITTITRADENMFLDFPATQDCGDVVLARFYNWCSEGGIHKDDAPDHWEQFIQETLVLAHKGEIPAGLMSSEVGV